MWSHLVVPPSRHPRRAVAVGAVGVLTFATLGAALPVRSVTADLPSPVTSAFLDGEAGAWVLAETLVLPVVQVAGSTSTLQLEMSGAGRAFSLRLQAPDGQLLAPGAYEDAERFTGVDHAALDLFGEGRGCNTVSARAVIDRLTFVVEDGLTVVGELSLRFEHHCEGADPAVFGAVSYRSTADHRTRTIAPSPVTFASGDPAKALVVTNAGPSTLNVVAPTVAGPDASQFVIEGNSCAAGSLAVGQSCAISVGFVPSGPVGQRTAELTFFDENAPVGGTGRDVPLVGTVTSPAGEFTSLTPARILDTRDGTGRDGVVGPIAGGTFVDVQVTGRGGVAPNGVAAVVLNATVTEPTATSYLTVWPSGTARPVISNLNFVAGQTVPNLVTVAVGAGGRLSVFNFSGTTHVVFDVIGFYADQQGRAGARFHAVDPSRLFDTRDGTGGVAASPIEGGTALTFDVRGRGGVPMSGVSGVVMNVTVTEPTAAGYLTVSPADVPLPLASNLNFVPGQTVPNLVTVRVPPSGSVQFYNSGGRVHVLADVVGYYDDDRSTPAGRFVAVAPSRTVDSRQFDAPIGPHEYVWIDMLGWNGIPFSGVDSVVLNVTATEPTAPSYLTVFPDDACSYPLASNLNFERGQTVPNLVIVRLSGPGPCTNMVGAIDLFNLAGEVHVLVDVFGWFTSASALDG